MAEAIDTAFVEIVPDFRNFAPAVKAGIEGSLAAGAAPVITPRVNDASLRKATQSATSTSTAFTLLGNNASRAGQVARLGMLGVGVGAAIALKDITQAGIEFESAFAGVRKTVNASSATLAGIRSDFIDLSTEIPVTTTELASIGEAAGQLGIETKGITEFTKTVAELGVTTNLTSEQAADGLARLANITQLPQDQFDNLGSTVVALGNKTASTEAEIVDFGLRISGAGHQIGLTQDQILAFGAALASVGIGAESGGTAISTTFIKIASNVAKGGKQLDAFAKVAGQSSADFAESFRTKPAQAVVDFIAGLGRIKQEGGNVFQTLDQLGLGGIRVRDALLRSAGAGDLLRHSLDIGATSWEKNTALQREASIRFGTTASKIQIAKNQVNALAIELSGPLVQATGAAFVGLGQLAQGTRFLLHLPKNLGSFFSGGQFSAANADLDELVAKLQEAQDTAAANQGGFLPPGTDAALKATNAEIVKIAKSLNDTPAGTEKLVRVFAAASPQIAAAINDGIITPSEKGELSMTALGRTVLQALPPNMFQALAGGVKSGLEDAGAVAKAGARGLGASLRSSIEDAGAQAKAQAAASGTDIGETLASSIATAATSAVKKSAAVGAASNEAFDIATAAGSESGQLAALRRKRDSLSEAINKITKIEHPGKARIAQRRQLRSDLASVTTQIEGIEAGIVSDQEQAQAEAKQKAESLRTAAEGRDRDFVSGLDNRRAGAERAVSSAGISSGLKDDLRANITLRKVLRGQVDLVKARVKDMTIRRDALKTLRDTITSVTGEIIGIRRDIAQKTKEAAEAKVEARAEALSDITAISEARGDTAGQARGIQAEITFWRKQALGAKAGSKAQRDALLQFEQKRKELREFLSQAKDDQGGGNLAEFFTQNVDTFKGIASSLGNVGVDPLSGFDFGKSISASLARLQASVPSGSLDVSGTISPSKAAPDAAIDKLIAALDRNTEATAGNTGTGSGGGNHVASVAGKRGEAMARFWESRLARQQVEDSVSG